MMAHLYQPVNLIAECVCAEQNADKAMNVKNELKPIIIEENDIQAKNLHWLKHHAQIAHQWSQKIESNIQSLDEEIIYQTGRKNILRKAINAVKTASSINKESLLCRSTKLDGDCQDEVESEMQKEKILIEAANSQLTAGLAEVEEYIERMKAAKEDLESLWSNIHINYNIECDNISLKQMSSNMTLKFGSTRESNREIKRAEWEENIELHIRLAKNLLSESYKTHFKINEQILSTNQRNLREQAHVINAKLTNKTTIIEEYIHSLKIQLTLIIKKQIEVERTMQNLEKTIAYLRQSLKLSQTRLYNRSQKPIHERFFDEAQQGLLQEEENIRRRIFSFEKDILGLEDNLKKLLSERIKLERELQLKLDNSWIDSDKCSKIRMLYPSAKNLSGL